MGIICLVVFLLAVLTILYVLFGYPLLLSVIARRHNHPVQKDETPRTVSVVVAVRNGERFLAQKIEALFAQNYPRELMEIVIVSDGSTDRTDEIAQTFAGQGVKFLRVPHGGKPAALNAAVPLTSGEILVLADVRQKIHRDCVRQLVANFGDPAIGAVSSELYMMSEENHEEFYTDLYWRYELWLRKQMMTIDSSFGCTGAFYAIRRSLWTPFPPQLLIDDAYLPLTAFFKGYRLIYEENAKIYEYPADLNSEFGRKVRRQAGLYQLLQFMPELLSSRNRMRFHFLSGKFGRMVVPYCLIVMALVTFGLPPRLRAIAAAGQIFFYAVGLLDYVIPERFPLKRLSAAVRAFLVLNAAALLGIKIFFVQPQNLWKETVLRETAS